MNGVLSFETPPDLSFHIRLDCGLGPSMNKRLHPMARSRQTKKVRTRVAARAELVMLERELPRATRPATLRFTVLWPKGQRYFDGDNLVTMLKPAQDGLKEAGLLVNDSPKWLRTVPPEQLRVPDLTDPHVRVDITYD